MDARSLRLTKPIVLRRHADRDIAVSDKATTGFLSSQGRRNIIIDVLYFRNLPWFFEHLDRCKKYSEVTVKPGFFFGRKFEFKFINDLVLNLLFSRKVVFLRVTFSHENYKFCTKTFINLNRNLRSEKNPGLTVTSL